MRPNENIISDPKQILTAFIDFFLISIDDSGHNHVST